MTSGVANGSDGGISDGDSSDDDFSFMKFFKTKFRILLAFCQLASSAASIWGHRVSRKLHAVLQHPEHCELGVFALLPFGCIYNKSNYYTKLLSTTMVPIVLGINDCLHRRYSRDGGTRIFFDLLLNLLYIVLPSTSSVIFRTLKCTAFEWTTGEYWYFLASDYSVRCDAHEGDSERIGWLVYASCMMLVYPLGIPLFFAVLLYSTGTTSVHGSRSGACLYICPASRLGRRWR